jgi:hypothetical protein
VLVNYIVSQYYHCIIIERLFFEQAKLNIEMSCIINLVLHVLVGLIRSKEELIMADFLGEFMKNFGPEVTRQMSSNFGINKNQAEQIIPQVLPMIMGGLKRQMETRGGAERVDHILNKYGSADVLDHIGDTLREKYRDDKVDSGLGGLLGDSGTQAANMLSKNMKLDPGLASRLIPMLAPIILGALSNKRDKGGAGAGGIAGLIDQDGDGQILDDVAGFLLRGLGGGGTKRRGGGLLGGLLGSLLNKKR